MKWFGCCVLLALVEQDKRTPLHFRYASYRVGDAHPFQDEGVTIVHFLYKNPNSPKEWLGAQARSKDLLHWDVVETSHAKPRSDDHKLPEYFVRGIVRDGSKYRTYYSNYGVRSSTSSDLKRWDFSEPHKVLDRPGAYGRADVPFVFWNEEEKCYWMLLGLEKENEDKNRCGVLAYATTNDLTKPFQWQGELYHPGDKGIPELSSMFALDGKWYLLTNWQDHRWVRHSGEVSYLVADRCKGPWKPAGVLDGKFYHGGKSILREGRRILWGWISHQSIDQKGGSYWGGHHAFPREVYALPDGRLGTRLERSISERIRGKEIQGRFDRADIEVELNGAGGLLLAGEFEIGVGNGKLFVRSKGVVHSEMPAADGSRLRVIVEEDIVEAYLDDRYSLAARISKKIAGATVNSFGSAGKPRLFHLKYLEEIR